MKGVFRGSSLHPAPLVIGVDPQPAVEAQAPDVAAQAGDPRLIGGAPLRRSAPPADTRARRGPGMARVLFQRVFSSVIRNNLSRAVSMGILCSAGFLPLGGCGNSQVGAKASTAEWEARPGVRIEQVVMKRAWGDQLQARVLEAADLAKKPEGGAGVAGDKKVSVAEIQDYLAAPADGRILTSVAMEELKKAAGAGKSLDALQEAWQRAVAEQAERAATGVVDGKATSQELDAYFDAVKKSTVEGVEWLPSQKGAVIKSAVAEETAEPDVLHAVQPGATEMVKGYMRISHDAELRLPILVSYALFSEDMAEAPRVARQVHFHVDGELGDVSPRPSDFGRKFDRGHQKPAADSPTEEAMQESFLVSNAVPQLPALNRGTWKALENSVRRGVEKSGGRAVVMTGALFLDTHGAPLAQTEIAWTKTGGVAVPTHGFKVVLHQDSEGNLSAYGYVLPNDRAALARLERRLEKIAVAEIERLLGGKVDLLPGVPTEIKERLKKDPSAVDTSLSNEKVKLISMIELDPGPPFVA